MSREPWFEPKRYGYGLRPANWRGWLFLVAFVVVMAGIGPVLRPYGPGLVILGHLAGLAIGLGIIFAKGQGKWRWRWGDGGDRDSSPGSVG